MNMNFATILFGAILFAFVALGIWMIFDGAKLVMLRKKQSDTNVGVAKAVGGFTIVLTITIFAFSHANSKPSGTIDTGGNSNTSIVVGGE